MRQEMLNLLIAQRGVGLDDLGQGRGVACFDIERDGILI